MINVAKGIHEGEMVRSLRQNPGFVGNIKQENVLKKVSVQHLFHRDTGSESGKG